MWPSSSIVSRSPYTAASEALSAWRAFSPGSAIAVTFTSVEPASARRWLRPIRPAPARPNLNAVTRSESASGEVLAIGALVRRGRPVLFRQHVLLDNDPSRVGLLDRFEHRVDVEVACAQAAKRFPPPDFGDRRRFPHDAVHDLSARVL